MERNLLNDAALRELARMQDTDAMRALFEERFRSDYPEHGFRVQGVEIEKVYYRIGKHCGVLYRVNLAPARGEAFGHWFFVRHFDQGEAARKFERAGRKAGPPASFWKPVCCWPDLDMVIWAFPHDPRLSHLPEVANPENAGKIIEENTRALGLSPGTRCEAVRCQQIKAMPGKRVVLRFEADLREPGGAARTLAFYSKTYADSSSRLVYRALLEAQEAVKGCEGVLEIPRTLLHVDALHTYWQEEWPGAPMSRRYGTPELADAMPRVARTLAAFHRLELANLPEAFYVDTVAAECVEDAAKIGRILPGDAERVAALTARIAAAQARVPGAGTCPAVPLHGAFRMSQLLENDGRVAMTDFDGVARGDPHYDVAEFQASLLYQTFRRGLALEPLLAMSEAFREAYAQHVPWKLEPRRLAWLASAFVLEKFHGTLKGLEKQIFPHIDAVYALSERLLERSQR